MADSLDSTTYDGIAADTFYHIEPLPGAIEDTDAALDTMAARGWELIETNGRNAIFKSKVLSSIETHDAFGRLRSSNPFTLGDYKNPYGIQSPSMLFATSSVGTAGITYYGDRASKMLSVTAGSVSGSWIALQSKKYHNYMPGKSQVIYQSFLMKSATSGSIKRVGYFDENNGIFLEQDATGSLNWVIRSKATGTVTETRVSQANWNINSVSTTPFVLDVTKTQLIFIDFQWLGVGRVRCGFVHEGQFVLTQVFDHTNILDKVWMSNPNLPVRYEITNVATTAVASEMEAICSTVVSEGGSSEAGRTWAATNNRNLVSVASGSTVPLLALRLKNSVNGYPNRGYVNIKNVGVFASDKALSYRLLKLPNQSYLTTGSAWTAVHSESLCEYNTNMSAYTDGAELANGYVPAAGQGVGNVSSGQDTESGNNSNDNFIAQNYSSTDSEIYVVVVSNLTGTGTTAGATLQWAEVY